VKLFDSTVLIAHLRGEPEATQLLRAAVSDETAHASVLSRVEVEGGMRSGERAEVARLFAALRLEPVDEVVAAAAARHLRRFRRSHSGIDIVDCVIAATAETLRADLVTLNVRHFPMFEDLEPAF
jgi:predicted nucleic acid-binding protein